MRRRARGQALAEFAITLPILLLILLGLFDLGRAVFIYNGLTNAVREGARLAIVNQDEASVRERAQAMAFGVAIDPDLETPPDPYHLTTFRHQLPNPDVRTNDPCTPIAVGCVAIVEAHASWQPLTPIIGSLVGPITLTARSELVVEFVCPNPAIDAYQAATGCPRQP